MHSTRREHFARALEHFGSALRPLHAPAVCLCGILGAILTFGVGVGVSLQPNHPLTTMLYDVDARAFLFVGGVLFLIGAIELPVVMTPHELTNHRLRLARALWWGGLAWPLNLLAWHMLLDSVAMLGWVPVTWHYFFASSVVLISASVIVDPRSHSAAAKLIPWATGVVVASVWLDLV